MNTTEENVPDTDDLWNALYEHVATEELKYQPYDTGDKQITAKWQAILDKVAEDARRKERGSVMDAIKYAKSILQP